MIYSNNSACTIEYVSLYERILISYLYQFDSVVFPSLYPLVSSYYTKFSTTKRYLKSFLHPLKSWKHFVICNAFSRTEYFNLKQRFSSIRYHSPFIQSIPLDPRTVVAKTIYKFPDSPLTKIREIYGFEYAGFKSRRKSTMALSTAVKLDFWAVVIDNSETPELSV